MRLSPGEFGRERLPFDLLADFGAEFAHHFLYRSGLHTKDFEKEPGIVREVSDAGSKFLLRVIEGLYCIVDGLNVLLRSHHKDISEDVEIVHDSYVADM